MKKDKFKYPCILYVSQTEDFSFDPYMKANKTQICIGKVRPDKRKK